MSQLLAGFTTLNVGGVTDELVIANTESELIAAVQTADVAGIPVLLIGGGSNLVIADDGFRGRTILVRTSGYSVTADACGGAIVTVEAGQNWDDFVADCVTKNWAGLEALSGIPGSVGATPIQNVGAYGQEVGNWIYRVRAFDRQLLQFQTFAAADCEFEYRNSIFKKQPDRYVVLQVTFQLRLGEHSAPVMYAELAKALGVEVGKRSKNDLVRSEVLRLRASKGMVLNQLDHDTWSVGSFFTNPVLQSIPNSIPETAPRWPQAHGGFKLSAAWLVENSGFNKGYGMNSRVTLSNKHALALTNRGDATANDVLELTRHIQSGVKQKFGIDLEIEPNFVGEFA